MERGSALSLEHSFIKRRETDLSLDEHEEGKGDVSAGKQRKALSDAC